jgi:hypothetical protein
VPSFRRSTQSRANDRNPHKAGLRHAEYIAQKEESAGPHMKFVLVNGRTPRPQSFCGLCCEPIGMSYVREFATRLCYCDYKCYAGHCVAARAFPDHTNGRDSRRFKASNRKLVHAGKASEALEGFPGPLLLRLRAISPSIGNVARISLSRT